MLNNLKHKKIKLNSGFSLIEVVLALAIFALFWSSIATLSTGGFTAVEQSSKYINGATLAREGIEAVKSISDFAWNDLKYVTSSVELFNDEWFLSGEGTNTITDNFERNIFFEDVCRDNDGNVVDCSIGKKDIHSKLINSNVSWLVRPNVINSVDYNTIVSNWNSKNWVQTNWTGGNGQNVWLNNDRYESDNNNLSISKTGQLTLLDGNIQDSGFESVSGSSDFNWDFTNEADYNYDSNVVELQDGFAQLVDLGGGGNVTISGSTVNPEFNTDANGWTFNNWEGNVNRTSGAYDPSIGNPPGSINIIINELKNSTFSAYWEQPFVTTVDNPNATLNLDLIIRQFEATYMNSFTLYAFVSNTAGNPVLGTEVWSQNISGITGWNSISPIDVSSSINTAGTYYLKIGARVITNQGPGNRQGQNIINFDNVELDWNFIETGGGSNYSTISPTIYPNQSFLSSGNGEWTNFTEVAFKNGGEIYYQLSDDDGITWQYWDGSAWINSGPGNYNTASEINLNISDFSSASNQIKFKAFLESDGSQFVRLDNVNIGFTPTGSSWNYGVWNIDPSESAPIGAGVSTGGNLDGYASITFPVGNNWQTGAYWAQSFTTYKNNPTIRLDFDYKILDFNGVPVSSEIRLYVDNALGDPVNQIGLPINFLNEGNWISDSFDISSSVTNQGTYYLKMAVWVDTGAGGGSGPFTIGFDNLILDMNDARHPLEGILTSSAFNTEKSSKIQVIEWDENVSLCDPNCEVELEIRVAPDTSGSPGAWSDWYGTGGLGTTFINPDGDLISTDLNDNQWVQYRTTLSGNGSVTPILNEIRLNYK